MGYEFYYIPVPIGLFIFLCAVCFRLARSSGTGNRQQTRRRRVIIIQRSGTAIPSQFESPTSPIITPDDGAERPHDFPPTYEDAQRYHQWQQQQMQPQQLQQQQQQQQGVYVKAMQGWTQQLQRSGEIPSAAAPTPANPPAPGNQQLTNTAPPGYQQFVNPAPEYQQPSAANQGTNDPASTGMLLDVTSLPCASAYPAPTEPANK